VDVNSNDTQARAQGEQAERELEGRQMRLRLWPDGTVTLNDGAASVPREVNDLVSVMPASFPTKPVSKGATWTREMPVPAGESLGIPAGSVMRARFRLDSASADGEYAWITMTGTLVPATRKTASGVAGSVTGSMVVNRKRGWLSESHFMLLLQSAVAKGKAASTSPFRMKVTQGMRVLLPAKARHR
ncbi:MAG TPA: hypothetical protein VF483_10495, partial [Gemmatimonadaceae bacterium]